MKIIIAIVLLVAGVSALVAFFSGGKKEDITTAAASGAIWSAGCIIQLIIIGLMAFAGLWLLGKLL